MALAETKERFYCNQCGNPTWHSLLGKQSVTLPLYSSDEQIGDYNEQWDLFQCLGCDNITLKVTGDYPWNSDLEYTFFPERTTDHHQSKRYRKLPKKLKSIYEEVVTAFNRGSLVLCTAGIRALLEGLCADKGIAQGPNERGQRVKSLEGKINSLTSIVPSGIVRNLHGLRFLGNQALHELEVPLKADLELALTIIEDVLNVVYDLDYRSQMLYENATRAKVPPQADEESPI